MAVTRTRIIAYLLTGIGFVAAALGVIGIFVPLLPTTPFLLLAAACFARSSNRLYRRLINHRVLGNYLRCYREYRAIPLMTKILAIALLWATIGFSAIAVAGALWIRIMLAVTGGAVTVHLLRMPALTPQMREYVEQRRTQTAAGSQP